MLPNTAISQISSALSANTKKKLMKMRLEKMAETLNDASDQVNHGLVLIVWWEKDCDKEMERYVSHYCTCDLISTHLMAYVDFEAGD